MIGNGTDKDGPSRPGMPCYTSRRMLKDCLVRDQGHSKSESKCCLFHEHAPCQPNRSLCLADSDESLYLIFDF